MLALQTAPVQAIEQTVREFVESKLSYDGNIYITRATPLLSGLLSSLDLIQLADFVEETFCIHIRIGEMIPENFESIEKITTYVIRKVSDKGRRNFHHR